MASGKSIRIRGRTDFNSMIPGEAQRWGGDWVIDSSSMNLTRRASKRSLPLTFKKVVKRGECNSFISAYTIPHISHFL